MLNRLNALRRRAIGLQVLGFLLVGEVIWLDEAIDLPLHLFHAPPSPFRPEEAVFELLLLAIVGTASVLLTNTLLRRLAHAESFISFCPSCQRIERRGEWTSITDFFQEQQADELTHSVCPACAGTSERSV
jgi:hypothetical protein